MTDVISFGPTEVPKHRRIPIELRYLRDDTELTVETFNVLDKRVEVNAANQMLQRSQGGDAEAFIGMVRLVAKFMDDRDGTPSNWQPVALPRKKTDTEESPDRFRAPDGKIYPWDRAGEWQERARWSSRRRWLYLMNEDDEAGVEENALVKLVEFLMELAGKDRTPA